MNRPIGELTHAARHLLSASSELENGNELQAVVHIREGITDAIWAMFVIWGRHYYDNPKYDGVKTDDNV